MNVDPSIGTVLTFAAEHRNELVLIALALTAAVLVIAVIRAIRRGRADKLVATITGFTVLALSAEGMWVVATERLGLPPILAGSVFFVAEAAMLSSAMRASRQYAQTTIRDAAGNIVKAGNPGKHGRAVWVIAAVTGGIVTLNSHSVVEVPLRLALPLGAAYLWWNALTADGVTEGEKSSWRWTPRRVLLWLGAIEAGERDARQINRDRQIMAMTALARRVHRRGRFAGWHEARLERLALLADDGMVAEVQRRVWRSKWIKELTDPQGPEFLHAHSGGSSGVLRPEVAAGSAAGSAVEASGGTPARKRSGSSGRKSGRKDPSPRTRRSAEETRQLAADWRAERPEITQVEIAQLLGISDRQLRNIERGDRRVNGRVPDVDADLSKAGRP